MWRSKVFKPLGLVVVGAMLLVSGAANALPTTFFGEDTGLGELSPSLSAFPNPFPNATAAEADFLSNLSSGVGTEDFETFGDETGAPLVLSFPGSSGSITATLSRTGVINDVPTGDTNGNGRYATSGTKYWDADDDFSITFSSPVSAFGFFGIDIGDFGGQVTATTAGELNMTFTIPNTTLGLGGSVLFWGIIDRAASFTSITFGNTAPGTDFFGFDDMTIGDLQQVTVPEPGTLAIFVLGLAGLAFFMRRRRVA